jgi:hypothetical protein
MYCSSPSPQAGTTKVLSTLSQHYRCVGAAESRHHSTAGVSLLGRVLKRAVVPGQ